MTRMTKTVLLVASLTLVGTGLVSGGFFDPDTVGERFRKVMEGEAEFCRTHKIAPQNTRCDITKLKPADPLATEEGRFAHAIQIPNPVPADSGYRPGMTSQEYFAHLCRTEAGEFIYKTVDNVEGLFMMRPREEATDDELSHLYALEDPYGDVSEGGGSGPKAFGVFLGPTRYQYLEMPERDKPSPTQAGALLRWYLETDTPKGMVRQHISAPQSLYGYIWRGLQRPHARELGIAGSELIIWDLQRQVVLAVRRGYIRSGNVQAHTGIWWLTGQMCPSGKPGRADFYGYDFVMSILKPKGKP